MIIKKKEKIQDLTIDRYYKELEYKTSRKLDCDNNLLEKLKLLENKLELINRPHFIKIDVQKIIEAGTIAKVKKQEKVNLLLFSFLSLSIITTYILLIHVNGIGFFVKLQIFYAILTQWILIPAALISKRKGVKI